MSSDNVATTNWAETTEKDHAAFNVWKADPTKKNLGILIRQVKPLIRSEVNKISGSLPDAALEAEATRWAHHAITTYDPTKGAKLSTHILNVLPKVKRLNYTY